MTTLGLTQYDVFAEAAVAARYGRELERAVAAERARCAAVCRAVAVRIDSPEDGGNPYDGRSDVARECADAIERGPVTP